MKNSYRHYLQELKDKCCQPDGYTFKEYREKQIEEALDKLNRKTSMKELNQEMERRGEEPTDGIELSRMGYEVYFI